MTSLDHAAATTFQTSEPIIATTYFYWYDVYTRQAITNPDGTDSLSLHPRPEEMADFSYRSVAWHKRQLEDMRSAGIDVVLPVFRGLPRDYGSWSYVGLERLARAWSGLGNDPRADNTPAPPMIGMFYDTRILGSVDPDEAVDLDGPAGRQRFYTGIRDFFSLLPPEQWARIDSRPVIFLFEYRAQTAVGEELYEWTRRRFVEDFAVAPFIIRRGDWPGRADGWYLWGGARGLKLGNPVAALGPGYDDSAMAGSSVPAVDRERGAFYERQWRRLLSIEPTHRPWIAHLETWNEWNEGTSIAASREEGDLYLKATAKYAGLFHQRRHIPLAGEFARTDRVRWSGRQISGLYLMPPSNKARWEKREIDGEPAVVSMAGEGLSADRYLYFDIDDSYLFGRVDVAVEISVTFWEDGGCGNVRVEYDASGETNPTESLMQSSAPILVGNSETWRTVTQQLPGTWFCNQTRGADFRLAVEGGDQRLTVREITVRRLPGTTIRVPVQPLVAQEKDNTAEGEEIYPSPSGPEQASTDDEAEPASDR